MKLQSMFQKDIDRPINGVIKVAQNDENSLEQELSEYIVTKELRRHFRTFFDNYSKAIDEPTDKIGVWISGFFGSGKSHFLKMLSYLLSNEEVCGKKAIDYFEDKFDDPMMYATAVKCASVPTESILFNIDIEGPITKDKTAVLKVFAKMFYNHCGFYGDDLKIAKLERYIEKQGKTELFRQKFEEINGAPWLESRDSFAFFEDDVVEVLQSVLGMSEQAARNWFNGVETNELSIAQLCADIKEYVDGKGKDFRLLFMVDEVGQYIGADGDLMMNLQSIVEEIGMKCRGKVWVMVTSQEAIDSVVKITGDDFSKIQGRFNTRLSLSSSSVDEVIKKRVLAKNDEASSLLRMAYDKEHFVLKNLYAFNGTIKDIKGFSDGEEFISTFPFVPYQFLTVQNALTEIRRHGNSGKHLSSGARSMLSCFQEAAQKVKEKDENALVPFYLFYDTIDNFLDGSIRRVIERCQSAAERGEGLEPQDVNVLELLYLIRYIEDIPANIDNITILMIDDIRTDKIVLRASVTESLGRLLSQNYISRNGNIFAFLTDEEQDVATDIKNTVVDAPQVIGSIARIVYDEIYPSKKFKYGKYDFAYDQYIDETLNGSMSGGMRLRIVTVASDYYGASEQKLIMESEANNEAIVVLPDEFPYYDELQEAMKIRKYVKGRNISSLPNSIQDIIRKRQQQARGLEEHATSYIEKAIVDAKVVVSGEVMDIKATSAKEKLDQVMTGLVESVYSKLGMVNRFAESDADILAILNGAKDKDTTFTGTGTNNEDALNEISQWLEMQSSRGIGISMGEVQRRYSAIPYGWREIDIAALVARLICQQKIEIKYGGAIIDKSERRIVDYLRKKSEVDKATVIRHVAPSESDMRNSIKFLRDYTGVMAVPADEDGLVYFIVEKFEEKKQHYQSLLDKYLRYRYPEKEVVENAFNLVSEVLKNRKDHVALLELLIKKQDSLLDSLEDMEGVEFFFKSQITVFDEARAQMDKIKDEHVYFATDFETLEVFKTVSTILNMSKPYSRIGELPELISKVRTAYNALLDVKKEEVSENIRQCMEDIHQLAGEARNTERILTQEDEYFTYRRKAVENASTLTVLDAMITQDITHKNDVCKRLEAMVAPAPTATVSTARITTVRRYDLCAAKRLQSKEDIDKYVEGIREKLYDTLDNSDGIQIS